MFSCKEARGGKEEKLLCFTGNFQLPLYIYKIACVKSATMGKQVFFNKKCTKLPSVLDLVPKFLGVWPNCFAPKTIVVLLNQSIKELKK